MKQNERLLVYAVTGFLALILVIAVLFGNDPVDAATKKENTSKGLNEILQPKASQAELAKAQAEADAKAKALAAKLNGPSAEQPLNAKPMKASDVVARVHGASRRERFVRWVKVKPNDAFEKLVRRWCGGTEGYLEEALSLNEDTTVLKVGSEVMVPWVDDEVLATIIEANSARLLASDPVSGSGGPAGSGRTLTDPNRSSQPGMPGPSVTRRGGPTPSNFNPRSSNGPRANGPGPGTAAPASTPGVITYKVKQGDSIWRIATKQYGKANAYKMVKAIKSLNPDLGDKLTIGQEFPIPAKAE